MKACFLVEVSLDDSAKIEILEGHTWCDYITQSVYFGKDGVVCSINGPHKRVFFDRREAEEWGVSVIKKEITTLETSLIRLKKCVSFNS